VEARSIGGWRRVREKSIPLARGSNVRAMAGDDTNRSFGRDP
jgi:hypothetical protein